MDQGKYEHENSGYTSESDEPLQQTKWEEIFRQAEELGVAKADHWDSGDSTKISLSAVERDSVLYGQTNRKSNFTLSIDTSQTRLDITRIHTPHYGYSGNVSIAMAHGIQYPPVMTEYQTIPTESFLDDLKDVFRECLRYGYKHGLEFTIPGLGDMILVDVSQTHANNFYSHQVLSLVLPESERVVYLESSGSPITIPMNITRMYRIKRTLNSSRQGTKTAKYDIYKGIRNITLVEEV